MTSLSIIVPTFNEGPNVRELVSRLIESCHGLTAEIIFVDDSTDGSEAEIQALVRSGDLPVRLIHRSGSSRVGGLGGAVLDGFRLARGEHLLVMDGDMQHPPELVPVLHAEGLSTGADVVVASRYTGRGGSAEGLANGTRKLVSSGSTVVTRAMFPRRLRDCTDPMTGFFMLRRGAIDLDGLQPRGFKILLEILARNTLRVVEVPFVFGERFAGESKASLRQGLHFLRQLASLRFGKMSRFAAVGAIGTVLNLALMAVLLGLGSHYLLAAVIATEVTILSNFALGERFVFNDLRGSAAYSVRGRLGRALAFNNIETLARIPVLLALVELAQVPGLAAQAVTLAVAFIVRFTFVSRVVYRLRESGTTRSTINDTSTEIAA